MIGGTIEQVLHKDLWAWTLVVRGDGRESWQRVYIKIEPTHFLRPGDRVWWTDTRAYWSPIGLPGKDIPVDRIDYGRAQKYG